MPPTDTPFDVRAAAVVCLMSIRTHHIPRDIDTLLSEDHDAVEHAFGSDCSDDELEHAAGAEVGADELASPEDPHVELPPELEELCDPPEPHDHALPGEDLLAPPAASGSSDDRVAPEPSRTPIVVTCGPPGCDITFYPNRGPKGTFYAHCKLAGHGKNCCKPRTAMKDTSKKGVNPGQGRCLGFLLAWLHKTEHTDSDSHKYLAEPSLTDRQAARTMLLGDPRFVPLLKRERPRNLESCEPVEPEIFH